MWLWYVENYTGWQSEAWEHPSEGFALSAQVCTRRSPHLLPFHNRYNAGVCGRMQCAFPGLRTPTYLLFIDPWGQENQKPEFWILRQRRDTKVLWLWIHQPWSYSICCRHLSCLHPRRSYTTHQRKERHNTNIITYAEGNLAQPSRCLCWRSLILAMQWSRKAPQKEEDTPLQVVGAIQVRGSPLSNDFREKLDLRLPSSSFRQNLRKLHHPVYCSNKQIFLPPPPSSLSYVED